MDKPNGDGAYSLSQAIQDIEREDEIIDAARERRKANVAKAVEAGHHKAGLVLLLQDRKKDMEKRILARLEADRMAKSLAGLSGTPLGDWAQTRGELQIKARKRGTRLAEDNLSPAN